MGRQGWMSAIYRKGDSQSLKEKASVFGRVFKKVAALFFIRRNTDLSPRLTTLLGCGSADNNLFCTSTPTQYYFCTHAFYTDTILKYLATYSFLLYLSLVFLQFMIYWKLLLELCSHYFFSKRLIETTARGWLFYFHFFLGVRAYVRLILLVFQPLLKSVFMLYSPILFFFIWHLFVILLSFSFSRKFYNLYAMKCAFGTTVPLPCHCHCRLLWLWHLQNTYRGVHACGNMEYEVNIILSGNTCPKQVSNE